MKNIPKKVAIAVITFSVIGGGLSIPTYAKTIENNKAVTVNYNQVKKASILETRQSMKEKRTNPLVFTYNNRIYAMAGVDYTTEKNIDTIEEYNVKTNKWVVKGKAPFKGSDILTSVCQNNKVYIFNATQGKVYLYNPKDGSFKVEYDKLDKMEYNDIKATSYNNKIYLIRGGSVEVTKCTIQEYDPINKNIKTKLEVSNVGYIASVATLGDDIYMTGEFNGFGTDKTVVKAYNPIKNILKDKASLTKPLNDGGLMTINNKLYKIGENVEVYDSINNKWKTTYSDVIKYSGYSLTAVKNKVFFIGGTNNIGAGGATNDVKALNLK
ncbi:Kelch motif-containing protein [Clostridium cavendishii DSM 21758]|uniref:Kelch motif-containing protein n=1 Tax=Clostridium cavendishii DSM 21758 TaxID=1121302 RepID=A0A1M6J4B6_9CLOT|nr:kelch repeat-containing protein [Clostridium cavendishii]SHJ41546.1 Kelch motif-containing protein [Clostridium cavendishii DSM 21758]